jgi:KDO2-lipid IV(A) lauroyltransferase
MPTHKKPESERFKGPGKYAEYLVARALVTVLQRLPIRAAYRLGRGVGWLAWKCLKRRRATVRKNLEIVNAWMDARSAHDGGNYLRAEGGNLKPEKATTSQPPLRSPAYARATADRQVSGLSPQKNSGLKSQPSKSLKSHPSSLILHPSLSLAQQEKEVFLRAGANLFAGFTFNRMSPEQAARHIEIEGIEHLKAALAEGKGVIVLLAHMGPWEALAQLPAFAKQHGIEAPFGAIYRAINNYYLDEWYRQQREARGTRMFLSRYKFYAPVDFLRSGGMLGVLSDQRASGGEDVCFFGQKTRGTPLPGLLAKRADCPMLAVAIQTVSPLRWRIRIQPVESPADAERNRKTLADTVARAVESSLLQSVEDGFWFHRRFR